jgi:hypothetical protein
MRNPPSSIEKDVQSKSCQEHQTGIVVWRHEATRESVSIGVSEYRWQIAKQDWLWSFRTAHMYSPAADSWGAQAVGL